VFLTLHSNEIFAFSAGCSLGRCPQPISAKVYASVCCLRAHAEFAFLLLEHLGRLEPSARAVQAALVGSVSTRLYALTIRIVHNMSGTIASFTFTSCEPTCYPPSASRSCDVGENLLRSGLNLSLHSGRDTACIGQCKAPHLEVRVTYDTLEPLKFQH
jgi:hypothetical protein